MPLPLRQAGLPSLAALRVLQQAQELPRLLRVPIRLVPVEVMAISRVLSLRLSVSARRTWVTRTRKVPMTTGESVSPVVDIYFTKMQSNLTYYHIRRAKVIRQCVVLIDGHRSRGGGQPCLL